MGISLLATLWLLGTPPSAAALPSPTGDALSDTDLEHLEAGDVLLHLARVPDTELKEATGVALIDAPPDLVYAVVTDYERRPEWVIFVRETKVEKREDPDVWVHIVLDMPWPAGNRFYTVKFTNYETMVDGTLVLRSDFKYVPDSGNIRDAYGSWTMCAHGENQTLVRYSTITDPGVKVPQWVRSAITKKGVPRALKRLKKRVEAVERGEIEAPETRERARLESPPR